MTPRRDGRRLFIVQEGTLSYLVAASNELDARAQVRPPRLAGQLRLDLDPVIHEATEAELDRFARQTASTATRIAAAA